MLVFAARLKNGNDRDLPGDNRREKDREGDGFVPAETADNAANLFLLVSR